MQCRPYVLQDIKKEKWKDYHGRQHGEINAKGGRKSNIFAIDKAKY